MGKMISINFFRRAGVLITGLSAAALIAACSSGGGPSGGGASAGPSLAPRHVLLVAATRAQQLTSGTWTLTSQVSGVVSATISETLVLQRKPVLRLASHVRVAAAGKSTQLKEIVTGTAVYFSTAQLTRQLGKPWVKVDLSALKGPAGASAAQLVRSLQSYNFSDQAAETLKLAKNVRVVGTRTVNGVPTTEYSCTLNAAAGRKALPASFRKALAPELRALGNTSIRLHVWIDRQNRMRRWTEILTVGGLTVHSTVTVMALNQPVHITLPPASQTATRPGA